MLARRLGRTMFGLALLGVAGVSVAPHVANRISTAAVVNAEVVRLVAPIDGLADPSLPGPGAVLGQGSSVPLVAQLVVEERELHRLAHDLALVRAQVAEARRGLALLDAMDSALSGRARQHAAATSARLAAELAEAMAEHAERLGGVALARADLEHLRTLFAQRHVAPVRVEAAEAALGRAESAAAAAAARVARLEVEARAAEAGLQLRDGQNDVPYTVQQRDRVLLERRLVAERLAEAEAREASLVAALAAERSALARRSRFAFTPETTLLVWERHATPGAPVKPGETLLDLVRCDRLFVEVSLPDRAFAALGPGDTAHVALRGGVALEGTIRSVRGAGARQRGALLAASRTRDEPGQLTVEVALPPGAAEQLGPAAEGGFCGIGRLAEVSFPAADAPLRDLAERLGALVRRIGDTAGWAFDGLATIAQANARP